MKMILIAMMGLAGASAFAGGPELKSVLSTGFVPELNASLEIESNGPSDWTMTTRKQCPGYPCNPEAQKTVERFTAKTIGDRRASDGCLVIELKSDVMVMSCSGRGVKNPYSLVMGKDGAGDAKRYDLTLNAYIKP